MHKIVIIAGATATGKSGAAVELAQKFDGEVISADSMQIYKGMDIGTAKITKEEMRGVPHYLVDELWPNEVYNVAIFKERAKGLIEDIAARGKLPIICGGTGFYINALLYDAQFDGGADPNPDFRHKLEELAREYGHLHLYDMLVKTDPQSALEIDKNNIKRVMRALEYYHITGECISEHNARRRARRPAYDARIFVLGGARELMYDRINRRVDAMIEEGLVAEVEGLLSKGYGAGLVSMQGLGYKEVAKYLQGEYGLDEAIAAVKQGTRRFAKRQIAWFKHQLKEAEWVYVDEDSWRESLSGFMQQKAMA